MIIAIVFTVIVLLYAGNRITFVKTDNIVEVEKPITIIKEVPVYIDKYIEVPVEKIIQVNNTIIKDVVVEPKWFSDCIKIESDAGTLLDCGKNGMIRW